MEINGKEYVYYNVDENKINYSQRNNKFSWQQDSAIVDWKTTCNVTAICMALDYAGFKFPNGKYDQPEDNLADFIMKSKKVDNEYKKRYPAMYDSYKKGLNGCYTPNEIHKLLEIGVNEWMEVEVDRFSDHVETQEIISDIMYEKLPVVISGAFPQQKDGKITIYNHVVCLVGVLIADEDNEPDYYVIDDPWGYTHDYSSGNPGNDVLLSKEQFNNWIKPINSSYKFAHRFNRPVAVI